MTDQAALPTVFPVTSDCVAWKSAVEFVRKLFVSDDKMNPYDHRPITFNDVPLAPAMMGVSIIECLVEIPEDIAEWLWRFTICTGVEKSSDSALAVRAATCARDVLLEHRNRILQGIAERLPEYDAGEVYRQWMDGFTNIIRSASAVEISRWSAPSSSDDVLGTPQKRERFFKAFDKFIEQEQKKFKPDAPESGSPPCH